MKVLGIDPGFGRLGFGIIEVVRDNPRMIAFGCFETDKSEAHADRLVKVAKKLNELIVEHKPELVGVEKLFFQKNVRTAMKVSEARGVILTTLAQAGIPIVECSPQDVKIAVSGYGKADKKQVQSMVQLLLKLTSLPKPDDAADALAIAIAASRLQKFV